MPKTKVVWICHFGNDEIRNIVGGKVDIFAAPWISELIHLFRDKDDIELTIISPNYYSNRLESFKLGKIQVFLIKYRISLLPPRAYNFSLNYRIASRSIQKIVHNIEPDIIHLHGSENPHYATSIIQLMDKYPVLVTLQGFVSLSSVPNNLIKRFIRWNRVRIEKKINTKASYFTIGNEEGLSAVKKFSTSAKIYRDHYPTTQPNVSSLDFPNKKYDIVFYARICKDKGIEDLLEALKILKEKKPDISAIILGGGSDVYLNHIKAIIKDYNLEENINLAGFQSTQQAVFKLAAQARVYVLPTHFDGLPGSIREAMFMRVPVIAYAVGGIPTLNDELECITLVEKLNIKELVEKIQLVLNDQKYTQRLVENAHKLITNKYDNAKIYNNLLNIYQDILKLTTNESNE